MQNILQVKTDIVFQRICQPKLLTVALPPGATLTAAELARCIACGRSLAAIELLPLNSYKGFEIHAIAWSQ